MCMYVCFIKEVIGSLFIARPMNIWKGFHISFVFSKPKKVTTEILIKYVLWKLSLFLFSLLCVWIEKGNDGSKVNGMYLLDSKTSIFQRWARIRPMQFKTAQDHEHWIPYINVCMCVCMMNIANRRVCLIMCYYDDFAIYFFLPALTSAFNILRLRALVRLPYHFYGVILTLKTQSS